MRIVSYLLFMAGLALYVGLGVYADNRAAIDLYLAELRLEKAELDWHEANLAFIGYSGESCQRRLDELKAIIGQREAAVARQQALLRVDQLKGKIKEANRFGFWPVGVRADSALIWEGEIEQITKGKGAQDGIL